MTPAAPRPGRANLFGAAAGPAADTGAFAATSQARLGATYPGRTRWAGSGSAAAQGRACLRFAPWASE